MAYLLVLYLVRFRCMLTQPRSQQIQASAGHNKGCLYNRGADHAEGVIIRCPDHQARSYYVPRRARMFLEPWTRSVDRASVRRSRPTIKCLFKSLFIKSALLKKKAQLCEHL